MHQHAQPHAFKSLGSSAESPVGIAAGGITDTDVSIPAGDPVTEGEEGLLGVGVVHLHRTIVSGSRLVAEIEGFVAGVRNLGGISRSVICGPEFDVAAFEAGAGDNALTLETTFMFATGCWKVLPLATVGTPILVTSGVKASMDT